MTGTVGFRCVSLVCFWTRISYLRELAPLVPFGGSKPSWKKKVFFFRSHEEDRLISFTALQSSPSDSPPLISHDTVVGTQYLVVRDVRCGHGPNSGILGSFVALRAFYLSRLIDCLEFTVPLPILEKGNSVSLNGSGAEIMVTAATEMLVSSFSPTSFTSTPLHVSVL